MRVCVWLRVCVYVGVFTCLCCAFVHLIIIISVLSYNTHAHTHTLTYIRTHTRTHIHRLFHPHGLVIGCIAYFFVAVITYGISVPSGLFVPLILIGKWLFWLWLVLWLLVRMSIIIVTLVSICPVWSHNIKFTITTTIPLSLVDALSLNIHIRVHIHTYIHTQRLQLRSSHRSPDATSLWLLSRSRNICACRCCFYVGGSYAHDYVCVCVFVCVFVTMYVCVCICVCA